MPAPVSTSTPPARPYPTVWATPVCASWVPFEVPVDGSVVGRFADEFGDVVDEVVWADVPPEPLDPPEELELPEPAELPVPVELPEPELPD